MVNNPSQTLAPAPKEGDAYRGTNAHRAVTVALTVCSPGSIGVGTAAFAAISIRASNMIGRIGADAVESSISDPRLPPAARASASASALASATALAIAERRAESALDEVNCRLEISFAPFASAASISFPTSAICRTSARTVLLTL
jgi:hypothetical protein